MRHSIHLAFLLCSHFYTAALSFGHHLAAGAGAPCAGADTAATALPPAHTAAPLPAFGRIVRQVCTGGGPVQFGCRMPGKLRKAQGYVCLARVLEGRARVVTTPPCDATYPSVSSMAIRCREIHYRAQRHVWHKARRRPKGGVPASPTRRPPPTTRTQPPDQTALPLSPG